jgi:hypothetical protein
MRWRPSSDATRRASLDAARDTTMQCSGRFFHAVPGAVPAKLGGGAHDADCDASPDAAR